MNDRERREKRYVRRSVASRRRSVTNVLMVTTTMRMLDGVHRNTTDLELTRGLVFFKESVSVSECEKNTYTWPTVTLVLVLVVSTTCF